jgi:hypothetical protein
MPETGELCLGSDGGDKDEQRKDASHGLLPKYRNFLVRDFERGWRPCPGRGRTAANYAAVAWRILAGRISLRHFFTSLSPEKIKLFRRRWYTYSISMPCLRAIDGKHYLCCWTTPG